MLGYVAIMRVRVRYFAAARDAAGLGDEAIDLVTTDPTVAAVRAALLAHRPALARVLAHSRLAVDRRFARDDDEVPDGAEVAIIPPVAGG
jgi:molybdopterin synthase catalytic subunit